MASEGDALRREQHFSILHNATGAVPDAENDAFLLHDLEAEPHVLFPTKPVLKMLL